MSDFTDFVLVEKYKSLMDHLKMERGELARCATERLEIEHSPHSTVEDIEWVRQRMGRAQARAAYAMRAIYRLPPLGRKL